MVVAAVVEVGEADTVFKSPACGWGVGNMRAARPNIDAQSVAVVGCIATSGGPLG